MPATINKLNIQQVAVSPELAAEWLKHIPAHQRAPSKAVVRRYAADMEAGRWGETADPIRFDNGGALIDGQHRLMAVVESGVTITFVVIYGLDPSAFWNLDQGRRRSVSCKVSSKGLSHAPLRASAARLLYTLEETGLMGDRPQSRSKVLTDAFVLELVDLYDVGASCDWAQALLKESTGRPIFAAGSLVYAHYLGVCAGRKSTTEAFLRRVIEGTGLRKGDPALAARNYVVNARAAKNRLSHRRSRYTLMRALQFELDGRECRVIRYATSQNSPNGRGRGSYQVCSEFWAKHLRAR